MEHTTSLPTEVAAHEQDISPMGQQVLTSAQSASDSDASNGTAYAVGGLICLIVGLFVLGIPCSILAINLGRKAMAHGSSGFGILVQAGGWVGLSLMLLSFVVS